MQREAWYVVSTAIVASSEYLLHENPLSQVLVDNLHSRCNMLPHIDLTFTYPALYLLTSE